LTITIDKPKDYKGVGRPCSLTLELQATICAIIAKGNYLVTACRAVGISDRVFYNWLELARAAADAGDEDNKFFQFMQAVKKAEAQSELALVEAVQVHNKRNVVAPLAMLDRRFRERWGQTQTNTQAGNTYNINIEKAIIDAAGKFDAVMARLAERTAAPLAIPADAPVIESPIYKEGDGLEDTTIIEGGNDV